MNYIQLGSGIAMTAYIIWNELRIKALSREVRVLKTREKDEEITEKIHTMPDADLDNSLTKHLG